ncbi:MAG: phosphoenolpyruvate carboxykinase (ATP), partial [Bacteroidota bacterium]
MQEFGVKSTKNDLSHIGINVKEAHWNLSQAELIEETLKRGEGVLSSTGALMCDTGTFTGRSPKDRFIVEDEKTKDSVWWGNINIPFTEENFDRLFTKMKNFLKDKKVFVREAYAGSDKTHRLRVRVINTMAWHNLFAYNMFLRPEDYKLKDFDPNFTILCVPEFEANPEEDGTRQSNFA